MGETLDYIEGCIENGECTEDGEIFTDYDAVYEEIEDEDNWEESYKVKDREDHCQTEYPEDYDTNDAARAPWIRLWDEGREVFFEIDADKIGINFNKGEWQKGEGVKDDDMMVTQWDYSQLLKLQEWINKVIPIINNRKN